MTTLQILIGSGCIGIAIFILHIAVRRDTDYKFDDFMYFVRHEGEEK